MTKWDQLKDELQKRIEVMEGTKSNGVALYVMAIKNVQDMMDTIEKEREPIKEPGK